MPSRSKALFTNKLLPGVRKLIQSHNELNPPGRGRRHLTHLTHGGVLVLCAAWELYVEEVAVEAAGFLVGPADSPDFLPDQIKGKIARVAKNDKHAHGALKLCGVGWKDVYLGAVRSDCDALNSPKFGNVSSIFSDWLSLDPEQIRLAWGDDVERINEFVVLRGEIAHRGADARYVRRDELIDLVDLVERTVISMDNLLARYLRTISFDQRRPWNLIPVHQPE